MIKDRFKPEFNLVVAIRHELNSQIDLDNAVDKLKALGIIPSIVISISEIQKNNQEQIRRYSYIKRKYKNIFYKIPLEETKHFTEQDYIELAQKSLTPFDNKCEALIYKKEYLKSLHINSSRFIYYIKKPICNCGLVLGSKRNISFTYIKKILEKKGYTNVLLFDESYKWKKINFDAKEIWFKGSHHNSTDLEIEEFKNLEQHFFYDRTDYNYLEGKSYWSEGNYKVVPIPKMNFDFSGDDLSLDPRLW